jgi:hypothetical protein
MTWLATPPTLEQVRAHEARGGLWRVLPRALPAGQPRPVHLHLAVHRRGRREAIVVDDGGELRDVIEDQDGQLYGARWAACTPDGGRV